MQATFIKPFTRTLKTTFFAFDIKLKFESWAESENFEAVVGIEERLEEIGLVL